MEPTNLWVKQDAVRFLPESYVFYQTGAANAVLNQIKTFSIMDRAAVDRLITQGPILGLGAIVRVGVSCDHLETDIQKAVESGNEDLFVADTMQALAEATGIDPVTFPAKVDEYHGFCDAGVDTQYKKTPAFLAGHRLARLILCGCSARVHAPRTNAPPPGDMLQ